MKKSSPRQRSFLTLLMAGVVICIVGLVCWACGFVPVWAGQAPSRVLTPGAVIGSAEISERPYIPAEAEAAVLAHTPPDGGKPAESGTVAAPLPDNVDLRGEDGLPEPRHQAERKDGGKESGREIENSLAADTVGAASSADAPQVNAVPVQPGAANSTSDGSGAASKVRLFGTVEFKRPLSSLPGWLDLLKRNEMDPIFIPGKYFKNKVTWDTFKAGSAGKSPMELLRYVNSFWNTWPYREDMANWGKEDYWEIPCEFLKKSGDCEDYAIIKYFTLKELGIPPENMRIVVVRDTIRNLAHAVLAVYLQGDAHVLDNLSNTVLSHSRIKNYNPQYSVNEFGRWAHLKGRKVE